MAFFNNNPPTNSPNGEKSDKKVKNFELNYRPENVKKVQKIVFIRVGLAVCWYLKKKSEDLLYNFA